MEDKKAWLSAKVQAQEQEKTICKMVADGREDAGSRGDFLYPPTAHLCFSPRKRDDDLNVESQDYKELHLLLGASAADGP